MQLPATSRNLIGGIDTLIKRAENQEDLEVQADYARYLTVRVAGLAEQVVTDIAITYVGTQASAQVVNHVEKRIPKGGVGSLEQILKLVGTFSKDSRKTLEAQIPDSEKSALGSLRAQRHLIAHGEQSDISLARVKDYFAEVCSLLTRVANAF